MSEFDPKEYWEERLRANFGLDGVGYIGLGKNYNKWIYKVREKVFFRAIKSIDIDLRGVKVLDIGSGTGFYIERWKAVGVSEVVGTDITNISVEKLKEKFPGDRFYQIDIGDNLNQLQIANIQIPNQYDVVSAFDVLYHIVDDGRYKKSIENIYALLRKGGFFIFSENFLHHETERAIHQVSRSLEDIEENLKKTGFQILKRVPMFVLMNFPVDSKSHLIRVMWNLMVAPVRVSEEFGFILGGFLYPSEIILTYFLRESFSTEIMICRKPD